MTMTLSLKKQRKIFNISATSCRVPNIYKLAMLYICLPSKHKTKTKFNVLLECCINWVHKLFSSGLADDLFYQGKLTTLFGQLIITCYTSHSLSSFTLKVLCTCKNPYINMSIIIIYKTALKLYKCICFLIL